MALPPMANIYARMQELINYDPMVSTIEELKEQLDQCEYPYDQNKNKAYYVELLNQYKRETLTECTISLKNEAAKVSPAPTHISLGSNAPRMPPASAHISSALNSNAFKNHSINEVNNALNILRGALSLPQSIDARMPLNNQPRISGINSSDVLLNEQFNHLNVSDFSHPVLANNSYYSSEFLRHANQSNMQPMNTNQLPNQAPINAMHGNQGYINPVHKNQPQPHNNQSNQMHYQPEHQKAMAKTALIITARFDGKDPKKLAGFIKSIKRHCVLHQRYISPKEVATIILSGGIITGVAEHEINYYYDHCLKNGSPDLNNIFEVLKNRYPVNYDIYAIKAKIAKMEQVRNRESILDYLTRYEKAIQELYLEIDAANEEGINSYSKYDEKEIILSFLRGLEPRAKNFVAGKYYSNPISQTMAMVKRYCRDYYQISLLYNNNNNRPVINRALGNPTKGKPQGVCFHYQRTGTCMYGAKCPYKHIKSGDNEHSDSKQTFKPSINALTNGSGILDRNAPDAEVQDRNNEEVNNISHDQIINNTKIITEVQNDESKTSESTEFDEYYRDYCYDNTHDCPQ